MVKSDSLRSAMDSAARQRSRGRDLNGIMVRSLPGCIVGPKLAGIALASERSVDPRFNGTDLDTRPEAVQHQGFRWPERLAFQANVAARAALIAAVSSFNPLHTAPKSLTFTTEEAGTGSTF